jgi:Fic family protein
VTEHPNLSPEQKEALVPLFKAAFELGYRQGLKGAVPADNDAIIRDTLHEAIEILTNPIEGAQSG